MMTLRSLEHLADLVAHDTTSSKSNLELIRHVADFLRPFSTDVKVLHAPDSKASLVATIGPMSPGGTLLSGHSDVVPVSGQLWASDPFCLDVRDGRAFGRGTADMKGFIACALSLFERVDASRLRTPIHLALTFDEEVGCVGAPSLIEKLGDLGVAPAVVIVGEPTSMRVVNAHKGVMMCRTEIVGREAHSSLRQLGVSAVDIAGRLIAALSEIERDFAKRVRNADFTPDHSTISVNRIEGGTATNILAGNCVFDWDVRCLPAMSSREIIVAFDKVAAAIIAPLLKQHRDISVKTKILADAPGLQAEPDGAAEALATYLTGHNQPQCVPYAAEAGQYQRAGLSTIIIGPGSIEQAHKADEFIEVEQLRSCDQFLSRLAEYHQ